MSLAVAIQMDHVASINIDADSTVMLAMEAQARGHGLFHYEPDALVFRDGKLFARAQPMEVRREKGNHFTLGAEEMLDLSGVDVESAHEVLTGYSVNISEPVQQQLEKNIARVNESEHWMHFQVADVSLNGTGILISPIDIFLGDGFMMTVHDHESNVIRGIRESYSRNFRQIAKSPGFLHFELVDHLTRGYTAILGKIDKILS